MSTEMGEIMDANVKGMVEKPSKQIGVDEQ